MRVYETSPKPQHFLQGQCDGVRTMIIAHSTELSNACAVGHHGNLRRAMIGLADCWCGAKMQPTARAEVQTNAYLSTALFSSAVSVGQKFIDHHSVECSPLAE